MNVYDGMHWNIYEILPYQRQFNFINGPRSLGKTYTCQMYTIDKCIKENLEFVYIVRTQSEKKDGIFESAYEKVIANEFADLEIMITKNEMFVIDENVKIRIGICIALSECLKIKKRSYPYVKFMIFDEYMLEERQTKFYVDGWGEPDLLISIYHTIDREEDRVIVFLLGNNTCFHNPYHLHETFKIPRINKGEIWTSKTVLFQWCTPSDKLIDKKNSSQFINMINGSRYSKYATDGNYVYDNYNFIMKLSQTAKYSFTFDYKGNPYGVYNDYKNGVVFISNKIDPSCLIRYALTLEDHRENTLLSKSKTCTHLRWLSNAYKQGNLRYVDMTVKSKVENAINLLL